MISFSNRFFYQKVLVGWIERGMKEQVRLVTNYFRAAGGFDNDSIQVVGDGTSPLVQLMSVGGLGGDPFVVAIAPTTTNNNK